jgi:hypothetical protein
VFLKLPLGDVKIIFSYQESWSHPEGEEIIEHLARKKMVAFLFIDEAQQNLEKFWGKFRKELMMGISEMRILAGRPPVINSARSSILQCDQ